jgi:ubiquinone biosynthesis protein
VYGAYRGIVILLAAAGYLGWYAAVRARLLRPRRTPPEQLCRTLERLGTTFVKLGQGLSLHRQLLPDAYVRALEGLQDHVAPFPGALARRELEHAFGRPVGDIFATFEETPTAAASIAQVHTARMADGREVVVKVRRPGIRGRIVTDLRLLRALLWLVLPFAPALRRHAPLALVDEVRANLLREIDLRIEARAVQHFAAAFAASPTIYIPPIVDDLYAETVLVQARSGGLRVDNPAIADGHRLAAALVDAYLEQVFVLGVYHADPHPGNLFIRPDGRICLHDFGIVGRLDRTTRRQLAAYLLAFVHLDSDWLLDASLSLGLLTADIDRRRVLRDLDALLDGYASRPLAQWSVANVLLEVMRLGHGADLRVPQHLLVLMRAMFELEATVRHLDPTFELLAGLRERAEEVLRRAGPGQRDALARLRFEAAGAVNQLPGAVGRTLARIGREGIELRLRHEGRPDFERHLDRAGNRIALALVTLGLYVAGSLLMLHSLGPQYRGVPLLALGGYGLALWFTLRLAAGINRSGRL